MKQQTIAVDLADRSYDILIGTGLLGQSSSYAGIVAASQSHKSTALIVSSPNVAPLYEAQLRQALQSCHAHILSVHLPDGESHKTWDSLNLIFDALLTNACDRHIVLYALGGGVVGDMTGFAASCYMRGVDFVQIPTTLLAQVDSSVGGKTAINHPLGKNMIGAFYQPKRVICDVNVLGTLPQRELSAGLAEVIKYGPIADMDFLSWLENHMDALIDRNPSALIYAVQRSCAIKAAIVGRDERESLSSGLRATLNFGHTFGHAIEAGMGYGAWLHGEAVAAGMVMAAHASHALDLIDEATPRRLTTLLARAGLPTQGPASLTPAQYLHHMRVDKKNQHGRIQYVLLDGPGHAALHFVDDALVEQIVTAHTKTTNN